MLWYNALMRYYLGAFILFCLALAMPLSGAQAQDFLDTLEAEILQEQAEEQAQDGEVPANPAEDNAEPDIPEAYIHEADLFYQHCEYKEVMRTHYDCECLAAHFLDARIAKGAMAKRYTIMDEIDKMCIDASEEAFNQYNQCKANTLLLPKEIDAEIYCTCYGNEYAKEFEGNKWTVSPSSIVRAQTNAHSRCAKGSYAVDNYATPPAQ